MCDKVKLTLDNTQSRDKQVILFCPKLLCSVVATSVNQQLRPYFHCFRITRGFLITHNDAQQWVGLLLDEWSARRRNLYPTTHNTYNSQTPMPPVRFEPTITAGEQPYTYALHRATTGTGHHKDAWWNTVSCLYRPPNDGQQLFVRKMPKIQKILKCGAGEGWRSVGPIMWEMKKYYLESRSRGIS
jgi:hypothetical protein